MKYFAMTVAVVATLLLIADVVNKIHMLGGNLSYNGQELISMTESQSWEILAVINNWSGWILKGASLVFLIVAFTTRKRNNDNDENEN